MAPCGHVHFHPRAESYRDDFSVHGPGLQGLFIHEMTHVWQTQQKGRWYLPLMRHPFCRYDYALQPDWPLERYGIEQQAEIVRHVFLLGRGLDVAGLRWFAPRSFLGSIQKKARNLSGPFFLSML